jgi:TolB-like protein/tetratricopeptide (TPR) repeat protein
LSDDYLRQFLAQLQRRNVFRVAGVYAVAGWLLAQAATLLETSLGLPGWFDGVIVAGLLIGFPVALILAWAFELTPEGVTLTADAPAAERAATRFRRLDYAILVGVALVATLFIADRFLPRDVRVASGAADAEAVQAGAPAESGPAPPGRTDARINAPPAASIGVLPFADLSAEMDQQYFADGVSEEILNVLARVAGLKVASRTSSFQFRSSGLGVPAIAQELGVRHVLEGSVRKAGDSIRVTAQLIDAANDQYLWSENYNRTLTAENIFAIQEEIAAATVTILKQELGLNVGDAASVAVQTRNVDAYELYLRARALFQSRRDLAGADQLLTAAVEMDPRFAGAFAIRAAIHQFGGEYGFKFEDESDARRIGRAYAAEALAIDPANSLAIAVSALSHLYDHMEGKSEEPYEEIFAGFERALELDPNDSNALNWLGIGHSFVGHHAQAVEIWEQCVALDPAIAACRSNLAMAYLCLGRRDAANAALDAAVDLGVMSVSPGALAVLADLERRDAFMFHAINSPGLRGWRKFGALYDAMTRPGEDHQALAAELKAFLDDTGGSARTYSLLNSIGNYERPLLLTYHWIPAMRAYRQSPEFKAHMMASGLPDYWRRHGFPPQCKPVGDDDFECR